MPGSPEMAGAKKEASQAKSHMASTLRTRKDLAKQHQAALDAGDDDAAASASEKMMHMQRNVTKAKKRFERARVTVEKIEKAEDAADVAIVLSWNDRYKARATNIFNSVASNSGASGEKGQITKEDVIAAADGGDFDIFAQIDSDGDDTITLPEWLSFLEGAFLTKGNKGNTWLETLLACLESNLEAGHNSFADLSTQLALDVQDEDRAMKVKGASEWDTLQAEGEDEAKVNFTNPNPNPIPNPNPNPNPNPDHNPNHNHNHNYNLTLMNSNSCEP